MAPILIILESLRLRMPTVRIPTLTFSDMIVLDSVYLTVCRYIIHILGTTGIKPRDPLNILFCYLHTVSVFRESQHITWPLLEE